MTGVRIINPSLIGTGKQAKELYTFFQNAKTTKAKVHDTTQPYSSENSYIQLTSKVVRVSEQKNNTKIYRYYVCGQIKGRGAFGAVYNVLGQLKPDDASKKMRYKASAPNKKKVVKHLSLIPKKIDDPSREILEKEARREAEISQLFDFLNMQKPTFQRNNKGEKVSAYLAMDELPGEDLQYYFDHPHLLNIEQRLHISVLLCQMLKSIHAKGIVHCDLSSKNIKIDTQHNAVYIFDFGLSHKKGEGSRIPNGTIKWVAPEILQGFESIESRDVYALISILRVLWNDQNIIDEIAKPAKSIVMNKCKDYENNTVLRLSLSQTRQVWNQTFVEHKEKFNCLKFLLFHGSQSRPEHRLDLDYLAYGFQKLAADVFQYAFIWNDIIPQLQILAGYKDNELIKKHDGLTKILGIVDNIPVIAEGICDPQAYFSYESVSAIISECQNRIHISESSWLRFFGYPNRHPLILLLYEAVCIASTNMDPQINTLKLLMIAVQKYAVLKEIFQELERLGFDSDQPESTEILNAKHQLKIAAYKVLIQILSASDVNHTAHDILNRIDKIYLPDLNELGDPVSISEALKSRVREYDKSTSKSEIKIMDLLRRTKAINPNELFEALEVKQSHIASL